VPEKLRFPLSPQEFQLFQALFQQRIGLHLSSQKMQLLSARLGSRVQELGLSGFRAYFAHIQKDDVEFQIAVDRVTTHETSFFREARQFEILRTQILPWKESSPLLVWSAACSTGEEPWTIAMVLYRYAFCPQWRILASDISQREIHFAQEAIYPMSQAKTIPDTYLKTCCLRGKDHYEGSFTFVRGLRDHLSFRQINLIELPPRLGQFQLIFLRNAIIYFDFDTKVKVLRNICEHLPPNGWLFLGHSESVVGMDLPLRQIEPSVYRKLP